MSEHDGNKNAYEGTVKNVATGGGRSILALRALALTTTGVALATGGHILGGGAAPADGLVLALGAVVLVSSRPLARRALRFSTLLPWSLAVQVGAHLAFSWLADTHAATVSLVGHHGVEVATGHGHHATSIGFDATMVTGHLAGTLLTVMLLAAVERTARLTLAWLRGGGLPVSDIVQLPARPRATAAMSGWHGGLGRVPGTDLPGRGPPLLANA